MKPLEKILPSHAFLFLSRLEHAIQIAQNEKQGDESVYLVGGTARLLASGLTSEREVTDIDILVTNNPDVVKRMSEILRDSSTPIEELSSCAGQKFEVGGIKCDIFGNDFQKWIKGAPCHGDMLAIDFHTGEVRINSEFIGRAPYDVNPNCNADGDKAIGYMKEHRNKLARDARLVEAIRGKIDANIFADPYSLGPLL